MTIEFADPGYNFAFAGWAILAFVIGVVLFFLPFWVFKDGDKIALWPLLGLLSFVIGPSLIKQAFRIGFVRGENDER